MEVTFIQHIYLSFSLRSLHGNIIYLWFSFLNIKPVILLLNNPLKWSKSPFYNEWMHEWFISSKMIIISIKRISKKLIKSFNIFLDEIFIHNSIILVVAIKSIRYHLSLRIISENIFLSPPIIIFPLIILKECFLARKIKFLRYSSSFFIETRSRKCNQ